MKTGEENVIENWRRDGGERERGVWCGLVWFGLIWFGLVWFGLVWFRLVSFGLDVGRKKEVGL